MGCSKGVHDVTLFGIFKMLTYLFICFRRFDIRVFNEFMDSMTYYYHVDIESFKCTWFCKIFITSKNL